MTIFYAEGCHFTKSGIIFEVHQHWPDFSCPFVAHTEVTEFEIQMILSNDSK